MSGTVEVSTEPRRVTLRVRGVTPKVWGSNEMEWRAALAEEARRLPRPADLSPTAEFRVEAIFYTMLPYSRSGDLDNLAKPVLDTLFHGKHVQVADRSLAGALFDVDDGQVVDLRLRKVKVASSRKEGVDLTIEWGDPAGGRSV
jgi:Holliday junction resolvase RusA-like endonuclease